MTSEPAVEDIVHLKHLSGSSATIARLGATILSLQTPQAGEVLWVDPDWPQPARGSNNRHGGIPVMFPTFGNVQDERIVGEGDQRDMLRWMKDTPHHGFAKDCVWELVTTDDNDNECDWPMLEDDKSNISHDHLSHIVLRLRSVQVPINLGGSWLRESGDWEILYRISLQEEGLIQDLCVKNKNTREDVSGDLHAKLLFHNYFRASSPGTVRVQRISKSNITKESEAGCPVQPDHVLFFKVPGSVDEVLIPEDNGTMNVTMEDNMDKITAQFDIRADNLPDLGKSVEGFKAQIEYIKKCLEADKDIVVWAPQVKEQESYPVVEQETCFVCIETGKVVESFAVPNGSCMFFRQVLST